MKKKSATESSISTVQKFFNHPTKSWLIDGFLLSLILFMFFTIFMGIRPLMVPDEGRYAEIPREMVIMGDFITPHINYIKYFEKPPLFYWMQAINLKLFGMGNFSMRLMTALLGLLGCLFVYYAARTLYSRKTGWLSALILATTGLYFEMSRYITLDMAVTVFITGSLLSFLLGINQPVGKKRNYYMWSFYVFSALATLTKGLIGIIFPGMIIFFWLLFLNNWRDLKTYCIPTGILLWAIIVVPWHLLVQLKNPEFFNYYFIQQQFLRYFTPYAHRGSPFWFFTALFLASFIPWICFLFQAVRSHWPISWQQRRIAQNGIFLMLWPLLIFIFYNFSHSKLAPYILPVFPPLAILVGHYLDEQSPKKSVFYAVLFVIILALGIAIYAAIKLHLFWPLILPAVLVILFFWGYKKWATDGLIILLFIGMMPLLLISDYAISVPIAQEKSTLSLALLIKNQIKPGDIIARYHGYDQDLPFYLQRRIVTVGWNNSELEFGMAHQNMDGWLWTDQMLWQRWNPPHCKQQSSPSSTPIPYQPSPLNPQSSILNPNNCPQIFLFMSKSDYNTLIKNLSEPLYLIGETKRFVVVTNKQ